MPYDSTAQIQEHRKSSVVLNLEAMQILRDKVDWYMTRCSSVRMTVVNNENGNQIRFLDEDPLSGVLYIDDNGAEYVGDD